MLGGFYLTDAAGFNPSRTTGLFTFGNNGYADLIADDQLHSYAAFAEGTYAFGDATHLTAGIRYTNDHRELNAYTVSYNGNINLTTASAVTTGSKTFD